MRNLIWRWLELRRSRTALLNLSDQHLGDIGLTRAMARDEAWLSLLAKD